MVPSWFRRMKNKLRRARAKRDLLKEEGPDPEKRDIRWEWF
jgi:hypothetical protein